MTQDIWEKSLAKIKERLNDQAYNTWFRPVKKADTSGDRFVLRVPNKFFEDWIRDNCSELILNTVKSITKKDYELFFEIDRQDGAEGGDQPAKIEESRPKPSEGGLKSSAGLNPRYTFENFVVGSGNQFSHAAALAVAEKPGYVYNPLFIYGGAGLGKTHLLNAIGHRLLSRNLSAKICYIPAESFMNELINGIRYEKMPEFRNKYRNMDLLLIDDIQFIAGKDRTQEEFFHTFNSLYEGHKQIVVASDKFPKDMRELDDRLRSRFEWGLIADIEPPDTETKVAILRRKAEINDVELPNDVAFFLARNINSNIRELEGLFNRLCAFSSLNKIDITIDYAKTVLKDFLAKRDKHLNIEFIQKIVASFFNIKVADLKSKKRKKVIAFPRQLAMYLSRELTGESYPEIGHKFGGKDHSTVIHAVSKIAELVKKDHYTKSTVDALINSLKQ